MCDGLLDWVAGDSACSIPPQTIPAECLEVIRDWTVKLAKELNVVGLINIQYCIQDNQVCHGFKVPIGLPFPRNKLPCMLHICFAALQTYWLYYNLSAQTST